jgi:hypothetical protein
MNKSLYADVVFLLAGKTFDLTYLSSWTNTLEHLRANNISYLWQGCYTPIITDTRNLLLGHDFLDHENNLEKGSNNELSHYSVFNNSVICQKVIFLDDDMVWTAEDIIKLLESPYDVTTGIYLLGNGKQLSVAITEKEDFLKPEEIKNYTEPFEIEVSGLGFVACTLEILKQLPVPWFALHQEKTENGFLHKGEDYYFFNRLKEIGASIYADPSIQLGHLKPKVTRI